MECYHANPVPSIQQFLGCSQGTGRRDENKSGDDTRTVICARCCQKPSQCPLWWVEGGMSNRKTPPSISLAICRASCAPARPSSAGFPLGPHELGASRSTGKPERPNWGFCVPSPFFASSAQPSCSMFLARFWRRVSLVFSLVSTRWVVRPSPVFGFSDVRLGWLSQFCTLCCRSWPLSSITVDRGVCQEPGSGSGRQAGGPAKGRGGYAHLFLDGEPFGEGGKQGILGCGNCEELASSSHGRARAAGRRSAISAVAAACERRGVERKGGSRVGAPSKEASKPRVVRSGKKQSSHDWIGCHDGHPHGHGQITMRHVSNPRSISLEAAAGVRCGLMSWWPEQVPTGHTSTRPAVA